MKSKKNCLEIHQGKTQKELLINGKKILVADDFLETKFFARRRKLAILYSQDEMVGLAIADVRTQALKARRIEPAPLPGYGILMYSRRQENHLVVEFRTSEGNYFLNSQTMNSAGPFYEKMADQIREGYFRRGYSALH